ncbi:hypothetical protein NEF87_004074 [Candidatus Lokiarchaeum ossiferum]|uniref:HTH marR-type domain-containing protein n=1 Tax=Candidatus Lokiarchaeum ossiferum TaxID=2951803 RepID=A0ABY6HZB4_9ARCH|nr:hypothetical protein NEF87_004074 [Candidatus Lokiarchaeum sp. B-35]
MNQISCELLKEKDHRVLDFLFYWKRPIRPGDLKKEVRIKHSTLNSTLKRLVETQLITWEKYGPVSLTSQGMEYAAHLSNHHFIIEKFLVDTLDLQKIQAHSEAIHLAGAFSCELIQKICQKYDLSHDTINPEYCTLDY